MVSAGALDWVAPGVGTAKIATMPRVSEENPRVLHEARLKVALIERIFSVKEDDRKRSNNSEPVASRFRGALASRTFRFFGEDNTGLVIKQGSYRP
jgi:hypothetical protein